MSRNLSELIHFTTNLWKVTSGMMRPSVASSSYPLHNCHHPLGGLFLKKLTFGHKAASLVATWIGANATTFITDTLRKCGTV